MPAEPVEYNPIQKLLRKPIQTKNDLGIKVMKKQPRAVSRQDVIDAELTRIRSVSI